MATITSAGAGNWGTGATWIGGVAPADGDTAIVNHALVFDADQTAMVLGVALTVNNGGSLTASTAAGTYLLKINGTANIESGGLLAAGSAGTPYPAGCTFTVQLVGAAHRIYVKGTNGVKLYGQAPTTKYVTTTAQVASGQVTLPVNATVDASWVGASVCVINTNRARNAVEYTVASVGTNSITLSGALSNTIVSGSDIVLTKRNVRVVGAEAANANQYLFRASGSNSLVGSIFSHVELRSGYHGINSFFAASDDTFTDTLFVGQAWGVSYFYATAVPRKTLLFTRCQFVNSSVQGFYWSEYSLQYDNCYWGGCAEGLGMAFDGGTVTGGRFVGNTTDINGRGYKISGTTFVGSATSVTVATAGENRFINCTWTRYATVIQSPSGTVIINCTATDCTKTLDYVALGRAGTLALFDSATLLATLTNDVNVASALPRLLQAYTSGALTHQYTQDASMITQASVVPTGYTSAYQCTILSYTSDATSRPFFHDIPIISTGLEIHYTVWLRRSFTPATLPRVQIFPAGYDPLDGYTASLETVMSAAINTWESIAVDWTPPSAGAFVLRIYFADTAAGGGSVYASWTQRAETVEIEVPTEVPVPVLVNRVLSASLAQTNLQGTLL